MQEAKNHRTGESETDGKREEGFGRQMPQGGGIRLASLNIQKGRSGGLETALRALQQGNVDVGFLKEKKLMQDIHTGHGAEYNVWATEAESRHQGGVVVVWQATKGWQMENTARFGPNVESFLLM